MNFAGTQKNVQKMVDRTQNPCYNDHDYRRIHTRLGIFAELLCGTGGQMMMKLAYERPVMRAEAFATNAYCDGCNRLLTWTGNLIGKLTSMFAPTTDEFIFSADSYRSMNNQVSGAQQYYYTGSNNTNKDDKNTYYLEYSADGNDFYLYRDEELSGYYDRKYGNRTQTGVGTLEVANRRLDWSPWEHSDATGWWYADYNLGKIGFEKQTRWTMS